MKQPAIVIPEGCNEVLLHACCAPCSSAIVEWLLANGVQPTIFYYNPNIYPREEYEIRKQESKRHAESLGIRWIDGDYNHQEWLQGVCGLESEPERGRRCEQCFTLRMNETAKKANELGIKYFATTLASSRWKSLEQIERAGLAAEKMVSSQPSALSPRFWAQNWRKGGLQERRNQLLKELHFYNQQYCGCEFSARQGAALTKPLLRQQMREAKKQHADQLAKWSADIVEKLTSSILPHTSTILCYWPLPDEPDIRQLINTLVNEGKTVLLPKVTGDVTMTLHRYTSPEDMAEGAFHIMEPTTAAFTDLAQIDTVLVPGVAFDAAGHRLGRGRGYYDRFLATCPQVRKVGICFPFQRVAEVPFEGHDIVMDEVIA
jgi:5,10-methenyltetrahydrofolate synthetase